MFVQYGLIISIVVSSILDYSDVTVTTYVHINYSGVGKASASS
jgi:hypothetical protein